MLISTKGRYALRILIDIAQHQAQGYVPLKESADRQEISEKYLESIVNTMVKTGFVEGLRGKGGGYRLTRKPEEYSISSILRLTEQDARADCRLRRADSDGRNSGSCRLSRRRRQDLPPLVSLPDASSVERSE